ncbi:MAG: hypothetical protein ACP5US_03070 [Candidatus Kryptoniota bacterium]
MTSQFLSNLSIKMLALAVLLFLSKLAGAQLLPVVPQNMRGQINAERMGTHDANNIRTMFYNFGMVGDYPPDPRNVDLSVFHSVEVPKGSGMNYTDGTTPFVLARIVQTNGIPAYIMETGYRERQAISPFHVPPRVMRFEPRPGYFQADPSINRGRSPAVSNDPRTWPASWPDRANDATDPGWPGSWDGYFGKRPSADEESYFVMDDDYYDAWKYYPDYRDSTRRGLGLRVEVRGFQWANVQSQNVIFWHYDIYNEGTVDYNNNIIFGIYCDSGVGGSMLSCDGVYESDDDNAYYTPYFKYGSDSIKINLTYTWDLYGHGVDLTSNCGSTGYLGYAYLETPGNSTNGIDDDNDGITDESRHSGPGEKIVGQSNIMAYIQSHPEKYNIAKFEKYYGKIEQRPAYRVGVWWTGDENMNWDYRYDDVGADGVPNTHDIGEGDGIPTEGEPHFDITDKDESDQIGLTGFKMNRIAAGANNPNGPTDNIVFFTDQNNWPQRLYTMWTSPIYSDRWDSPVVLDYNIAFLFASGPFVLKAGNDERFSLALAFGSDLTQLEETVHIVQLIYNANYQFAVPPPMPTLHAEAGNHYVRLSWDDVAEYGIDPITNRNDFEGYRIYRSTDPEFLDPRVITNARGTGFIGNGKPIAQFDLKDGIQGYSKTTVDGTAYYLGNESGLTHTFVDTTVTNGQDYFYAVTAYNYGSDSLGYYPSENAISVSRTPLGGTILPKNVVEVRPEAKVLGFVGAAVDSTMHISGNGVGKLNVQVVNSDLVPENHVYLLSFRTSSPDSVRAEFYDLRDSTTHQNVIIGGTDFSGSGTGPVADGILPVVSSISTVSIDSTTTGFIAQSTPNLTNLIPTYLGLLPSNYRRQGYPGNVTVTFSNVPLDTTLPAIGMPTEFVNFRAVAHTDSGDVHLKCYFYDQNKNGKFDGILDYIRLATFDKYTNKYQPTWKIQFDTTGLAGGKPFVPPGQGDVYQIGLHMPLTPADTFSFRTKAEYIDQSKAKSAFASSEPYVVPNPYVASASFEPALYAVFGRGERRMEFRNLPRNCTIRIYTVKGDLVRTLYHDDSNSGMVAWDLRTKDNLDVAPGLYIYQVDAGQVGTYTGKFAIIK